MIFLFFISNYVLMNENCVFISICFFFENLLLIIPWVYVIRSIYWRRSTTNSSTDNNNNNNKYSKQEREKKRNWWKKGSRIQWIRLILIFFFCWTKWSSQSSAVEWSAHKDVFFFSVVGRSILSVCLSFRLSVPVFRLLKSDNTKNKKCEWCVCVCPC